MSRSMAQLKILFRFWTFLFACGGLVFFLFPQRLLQILNRSTEALPFLAMADPRPSAFWLCLALSLMVTLTFMAWQVSKDVEHSFGWIVAILLSKASSTLFFVFFYFKDGFPAPYFWGALCDGLIFLITFWFFKRAFQGTPAA